MIDTMLEAAHKRSACNKQEIEKSDSCGCFHCGSVLAPSEIQDWLHDRLTDGREGDTAICPKCGIDSVLGSASGFSTTTEFLGRMREYWFGQDSKRRAEE